MLCSALDLAPTIVAMGIGMLVAVVASPPPAAGTFMRAAWAANAAFLVLNTCVLVFKIVA